MFKVISFDFGGTIAYEVKEDHIIYQQILNELGYAVKTKNIISSLEKAREWWSSKRKHGMIWAEETFIQYIKQILNQLSISNDDLAVKIASFMAI